MADNEVVFDVSGRLSLQFHKPKRRGPTSAAVPLLNEPTAAFWDAISPPDFIQTDLSAASFPRLYIPDVRKKRAINELVWYQLS